MSFKKIWSALLIYDHNLEKQMGNVVLMQQANSGDKKSLPQKTRVCLSYSLGHFHIGPSQKGKEPRLESCRYTFNG